MPKLIKPNIENDVKRLSKENYSHRVIQSKLKEEDVDVSLSSICRILNGIGINRQATMNGEKKPKKCYTPVKRTPEMIKKIKDYVTKENPRYQKGNVIESSNNQQNHSSRSQS